MSFRITSAQIYIWKLELEKYFSAPDPSIMQQLKILGIHSTSQLYITKFINLLCRKGRNSSKYELNNKRFLNVLTLLTPYVTKNDVEYSAELIYFTCALINGLVCLKVISTRQGSVNISRKIFLFPNTRVSVTLRKLAQYARSMKPAAFANQLKLLSKGDLKSKMIGFKNEQTKLAKFGVE